MAKAKTKQHPTIESAVMRARLQELEDTLEAIRSGAVDAIVTSGPAGERVYTLEGADHAYHTMVESMNEGAVTLLPDGTILYGNRHFGQMTGASPSEIVGRPFHDFVQTSHRPIWNGFIHQASSSGLKAEIMLRNESAAKIPVQVSATPIDLGGTKAIALVVTDLSDRMRYEEIVAAERLLRYILEQSLEGVAVCINGRILFASRSLHGLCGRNPLMQSFDELFPLRMSEFETFSVEIPHSGKVVKGSEVSYQNQDGESYSMILNAGPLYGDDHKILGCLVNLTDITERKRAEEELRGSEEALRQANESLEQRVRERTMDLLKLTEQLSTSRDDLRRLASELVLAEERERKRIAVTLHDEVAQTLAAARMRIDLLRSLPGDNEYRQLIEQAQELLSHSIRQTRALMTDISNPVLYDLGLCSAVEALAEQIKDRHGIQVQCLFEGNLSSLSQDLNVMVFQVVKELVQNVIKHSGAHGAHIRIIEASHSIRAIVADDGVGFDGNKNDAPDYVGGGFGLFSIRERVKSFNGNIQIKSRPGIGSEVTVELPKAAGSITAQRKAKKRKGRS
jgi:PAS domain S-box-containing protein